MRCFRMTRALWAVLVAASTACSDGGGTAAPSSDAPGDELSYETQIQGIWSLRCGSSCHGANGNGGLDLRRGQSYTNLVGVTSPNYGAPRIAPNDPEGSVLFNKITDTGLFGELMPNGGPALGDTDIELIRAWILDGAPNGPFEMPEGEASANPDSSRPR